MIRPFGGKTPLLGEGAFVAETASVIGDVIIGARSSIWYGAVLRGDVEKIRVGDETSIQDNTVIHVDSSGFSTEVGNRVTVGHSVVLHGCRIGNAALIGIGSIVLNGAEVGDESMIGAGSLVTPGTRIPSGVLALGSPARVKRPLTEEEKRHMREGVENYIRLCREHR
ncbi:MAG TPA: gamma carbonic anhydrase family protein [Myxococcales bacterium]|nr:gamma carbonic anhydrase family protein [Myxococcales bacterium]